MPPSNRLVLASLALAGLAAAGCSSPEGTIDVDLSSVPPRFIVDHKHWPRPFWWPRVNEFAIGSEKDDLLWHLHSADGLGDSARSLAFVYGQVPSGWVQAFPADGVRPKALVAGRSYYVGAVGPKAVYRVVFALPLSPEEAAARRRRVDSPQGSEPREAGGSHFFPTTQTGQD